MDPALSAPIGSHDGRRLEIESLTFEFTMGQHKAKVLSAEQTTKELAAQEEPWTPIATPITVEGFRFDDEEPLKDGDGGCSFRHFFTADKAMILWNTPMEWARRPYEDMREASTQAPNHTGNEVGSDDQTKTSEGTPTIGEAVPKSTQHEPPETLDGKGSEITIAVAGSGEDPTKTKQDPPRKEKPIKFTDAVRSRFDFPFDLCETWAGMKFLIWLLFLDDKDIEPHAKEGHYDLVGPTGAIIHPAIWENVIKPDWTITMEFWPLVIQELQAKIKTRETEARSEESKGTKSNYREIMEDLFGLEEDDSEPRGRSPPASLRATIARRPATPTIAIDLEEGTGESSSKPDQDDSKLQLPAPSENAGEQDSVEGVVELEQSQIPPSQPPNLPEESLLRNDSGIEMD